MKAFMASIGNPEKRLKVIHIAGTSGKTSTAYYMSAFLVAAGKRMGLSVSPYTYALNDRLQLNGQPLEEKLFCEALEDFLKLYEKSKIGLGYLELLTAFAYWQLDRLEVEYAVIETNAGGLFDATNVADRPDKIAIITDIGFDHVGLLGTTLPAIAANKAGIIHQGNQAFMLRQSPEVTRVIADYAQRQSAALKILDVEPSHALETLPLFQQRNWSLAKQAHDYIAKRDGFYLPSPKSLDQTMKTVIPGRMEQVICAGTSVVLDVAHNPQKMGLLVESLQHLYPAKSIAVIAMIGSGKDASLMLKELSVLKPHLICSEYSFIEGLPHQATSAITLASMAAKLPFAEVTVNPNNLSAFDQLLCCDEPVKLVTGSLYGVSQIKHMIDVLHSSA